MVPYDLIKEVTIALVGILGIVLILSALLSSPDLPAVTIQSWAKADPIDFVTTATGELAGTTTVANYGPPYNMGAGPAQSWGFLHPQEWAGVHVATNPPNDFVIEPLKQATVGDAHLAAALAAFKAATSDEQFTWLTNYGSALGNASVNHAGGVAVAPGNHGPLPVLMDRMLTLARSGGLDALLLTSNHFYQTDFTRPLLFMDDGGYFASLAQDQKLTGSQWGMMNETGRYPGQAWLWLYTMWYQIPPYNSDTGFLDISAANADLAVVGTMALLSVLLILVPVIPGLRDIPRWIPIHKLIWGRYYASTRKQARPAPDRSTPTG